MPTLTDRRLDDESVRGSKRVSMRTSGGCHDVVWNQHQHIAHACAHTHETALIGHDKTGWFAFSQTLTGLKSFQWRGWWLAAGMTGPACVSLITAVSGRWARRGLATHQQPGHGSDTQNARAV